MKKSFLSTFFEPIFHNKKLLVLSIFTRIILSVFGIINIFFLQKIVVVLEN
ncbi:MAG: hypothetical protein LBQ59_05140 [Candidatus Peribacteria bacterium]|nr:hypothetical protein [Candidatus Peribacteria bacterium]